MKRLIKVNRLITLGFAISLISSLYIAVPSSAAPGYADDYQSIQSIGTGTSGYGDNNCSPTDISKTWQKYITDPSTWRNPDDASNPSSSNYQAKVSFETALNSGRWGVSQYNSLDGSDGSGYHKGVAVFWTEDTSLSLNWAEEGVFAASTTNDFHYLFIACRGPILGNQNPEPITTGYNSGNVSIMISYDKPFSSLPATGGSVISNYFIRTDYPNYPSGYTGSVATLLPITGNVQCANSANIISAVHIDTQSGVDGNAILTNDGMGGKDYRYYLSGQDDPYSIVVTCDEDQFYGPTVSTSLYSNYYWVCTHTTPGQSPNLNVCAAS